MKGLKIILVSTYIIIIILLLLSLKKCNGQSTSSRPEEESTTVKEDTETVKVNPEPAKKEAVKIREKFNADVVLCIDCTGSMSSLIGTIKNNALNFYPDMKRRCESQGKEIMSMRIKVIGFRDITDNVPFEVSEFFRIPEQEENFKSFVSNLRNIGGGDDPERAYDAISLALLSNWSTLKDARKVIILWTDAASHPLSGRIPEARNFKEMTELWNTRLRGNNKRLILFSPSHSTWKTIESKWSNTTRHDVRVGGGLTDVDYDEILKTLSESI